MGRIGAASVLVLGAVAAAALASPLEVNPHENSIVVRADIAHPSEVRLEVRNSAGTIVALTPPRHVQPGLRGIPWRGGRGPDAGGQSVPDGVYRLRLRQVPGPEASVRPSVLAVDTRAPRVSAHVSARAGFTLPPSLPSVSARIRDATKRPEARVVFSPPTGKALTGQWSSMIRRPPLPRAIATGRRAGPFEVTVEARDAAGNVGTSRPVTLRVPTRPGRARVVRRVATGRPWVTLAFDDGLHSSAMSRIVSTLRAHGMGATFCLNGVNAGRWGRALRMQMRSAVADGVLDLCSHGYSHRTNSRTGYSAARMDLARNVVVDRAIGASTAPLYRPPSGLLSPGLVAAAGALGYRTILMWDVDPFDFLASSPAAVSSHVIRRVRKGSVVVLHAQPVTAAALPAILSGLRSRGLRSVPAGRLLAS